MQWLKSDTAVVKLNGDKNMERHNRLRSAIEPAEDSTLPIRVALYLQTSNVQNRRDFNAAMKAVKNSGVDILVFPEYAYVPFHRALYKSELLYEREHILEKCLSFSKKLGCAVLIGAEDKTGIIYGVYANAQAGSDETKTHIYIKHTMTKRSAFELPDYSTCAKEMFQPIALKGHKLGMTICYDCNHAIFSRMFSLNGADIILNGTGGNVVFDKWYKYNKARAIENHCWNFVTMGGEYKEHKSNSYVYAFTPGGRHMQAVDMLSGKCDANVPGGLYLFDTEGDSEEGSPERSLHQKETLNKHSDYRLPVGRIVEMLSEAKNVSENLYVDERIGKSVVYVVADAERIYLPEKFLPLLYSHDLDRFKDRKYVLINRWKHVEQQEFEEKLSVVLKARAMENFCVVIHESDYGNYCYQCGLSKTAQVVKPNAGYYDVDLSRAGGPDSIWRQHAKWKRNLDFLIDKLKESDDAQGR